MVIRHYLFYLYFSIGLTVALLFFIALFGAVFEYNNFTSPGLFYDPSCNLSPLNSGLTDFDIVTVSHHQNIVKNHPSTAVGAGITANVGQFLKLDSLPLADFILLAARFDYSKSI